MPAMKGEGIQGRSDVYKIDPNFIQVQDNWNPRENFGGEMDEELKNSIIENGVLIPLRVKKNGDGFILIDGERRLRAVRAAIDEGSEIISVPTIVERKAMSEIDSMVVSLVANTGKPLSPIEEANAYKKLKNWGVIVKDIAKKVGKSSPHVYGRLKLVDASPELQEAVDNKEVTVSQAKEIVEESEGSIEKQKESVEKVKEERQEQKEHGKKGKNSSSKKVKETFDREEIQSLLDEAVNDFNDTEDENQKAFASGLIRAYAIVLEVDEPVSLDYWVDDKKTSWGEVEENDYGFSVETFDPSDFEHDKNNDWIYNLREVANETLASEGKIPTL